MLDVEKLREKVVYMNKFALLSLSTNLESKESRDYYRGIVYATKFVLETIGSSDKGD